MSVTFFVISGLFAGTLTSVTKSWVYVLRQEYRNHQERRLKRRRLPEMISRHHGVPWEEVKPGRHRLEGCAAAHDICTEADPCVYRGYQNGLVHVEFYLERARLEAEYEREQPAEWPRQEDVDEFERMGGLLCGYRTPSSFPGLSTPSGSSADFTAASTSTPRSPISVDR